MGKSQPVNVGGLFTFDLWPGTSGNHLDGLLALVDGDDGLFEPGDFGGVVCDQNARNHKHEQEEVH